MFADYYPDRKILLDDLEFFWWFPPSGLDRKYFEPLTQVDRTRVDQG